MMALWQEPPIATTLASTDRKDSQVTSTPATVSSTLLLLAHTVIFRYDGVEFTGIRVDQWYHDELCVNCGHQVGRQAAPFLVQPTRSHATAGYACHTCIDTIMKSQL